MAFVTDSNRPQPLWQPPPTACLTASGAASEAPSLLNASVPVRTPPDCTTTHVCLLTPWHASPTSERGRGAKGDGAWLHISPAPPPASARPHPNGGSGDLHGIDLFVRVLHLLFAVADPADRGGGLFAPLVEQHQERVDELQVRRGRHVEMASKLLIKLMNKWHNWGGGGQTP